MQPGQASASHTIPAISGSGPQDLLEAIRIYWNEHIHDLDIAEHPIGTKEFFGELTAYRFEKLAYLPQVVDFSAYKGQRLLEVGCGLGIDLVQFARHGATVTGIDLAEESIRLAREHFALNGLDAELRTMDGEHFLSGSLPSFHAPSCASF